jgi:protein-S-isoprenylcysteine O-methyltransferase Ste14
MWAALYAALVIALFVRFGEPSLRRTMPAPGADEPLRLVSLHHVLFYTLLLLVCPLEAVVAGDVAGGASGGRVAGALAFGAGVALYRWGAAALGDALSPLVRPHPGGRLVTAGPYRTVRHPMYLGQLLIAFGAPALLGCRFAFALSFAAAVVLFVRIGMEENALGHVYAEYGAYRARSKRLLPFVF